MQMGRYKYKNIYLPLHHSGFPIQPSRDARNDCSSLLCGCGGARNRDSGCLHGPAAWPQSLLHGIWWPLQNSKRLFAECAPKPQWHFKWLLARTPSQQRLSQWLIEAHMATLCQLHIKSIPILSQNYFLKCPMTHIVIAFLNT